MLALTSAAATLNLVGVEQLEDHMDDGSLKQKPPPGLDLVGVAPLDDHNAQGALLQPPGAAATGDPAAAATAGAKGSKDAAEDDEFGDLSQYHPVRRICIRLASNPDFELFVIVVIVANCLTLCLFNPLEPDNSKWNMWLFNLGACSGVEP